MKKCQFTAILALATAISAGAQAADMPVKATPPVSTYDPWTGCYVGGNAAWARFKVDTTFPGVADFGSSSGDGWSYGGQIGCDARVQSVVVGIRGLWDGVSDSTDKTLPLPNLGNFSGERQNTKLKWFSTLDAKLGIVASPNFMIYGVGGWAWSGLRTSFLDPFDASSPLKWQADASMTGYNFGVGASWIFAPNWEVWVEYDRLQFGERQIIAQGVGTQVGVPEPITQNLRVDTVLLGVNYRFNLAR
ncbi:MAG TPA: porin family protein [Pseudorhodoplanes sp.]|nr:porin family protein [Pseudorhodoplanes sp.]